MYMLLDYNRKLTERAKQLRKDATDQERKLWYCFLRNYPIRIIRQRPIDNYIVDFYCPDAKLVIEIDGSQHFTANGEINDAVRTEILVAYGLSVIRFTNTQVDLEFNVVCRSIDDEIKRKLHFKRTDKTTPGLD